MPAGWSGRCSAWGVPADPHQVGWEKGLWIPTSVRMTGGSPRSHMRMKMACSIVIRRPFLSPTPVILAAAGIQSPDQAPGLSCQPGGQAGVLPGAFLQTRIRLDGRKGSGFPLR